MSESPEKLFDKERTDLEREMSAVRHLLEIAEKKANDLRQELEKLTLEHTQHLEKDPATFVKP